VKKKRSFPWLRILVHVIGWVPLAVIVFDFATNNLTINPIQEIEMRLGRIGLYFLVASLAVTPVYTVTGWKNVLPRRRALGLYSFLYMSLHILVFLGVDYAFNVNQLFPLLFGKLYLIAGVIAYALLVPLAVTSFDYFIRTMRKNWKRLHWLIYPAGIIVILHYAWSLKGDIFHLRGNISQPLIWGLIIIALLVLRLPPVRRWFSSLRQRRMHSHVLSGAAHRPKLP
jgi:sulfoxide reductase heme-binding subunit YedZ